MQFVPLIRAKQQCLHSCYFVVPWISMAIHSNRTYCDSLHMFNIQPIPTGSHVDKNRLCSLLLRCAVSISVMQCPSLLCSVPLCYAVSLSVMQCPSLLCSVPLCCAVSLSVVQCPSLLCSVHLCCAVSLSVMQCQGDRELGWDRN